MDGPGTYFVGRAELLAWINTTLDLNYTKIEQVRQAFGHRLRRPWAKCNNGIISMACRRTTEPWPAKLSMPYIPEVLRSAGCASTSPSLHCTQSPRPVHGQTAEDISCLRPHDIHYIHGIHHLSEPCGCRWRSRSQVAAVLAKCR